MNPEQKSHVSISAKLNYMLRRAKTSKKERIENET
jgi:hypothetical protein